jgi:hypothetical protein
VSYAIVQDVAASWAEYERVALAMIDPEPQGLILHVAGPTDEGVRTIGVWESEEAWQRFRAERLAPAIAALGPSNPELNLRELRAVQLVVGRPIDIRRAEPPVAPQEKGERS